MLMALLFTNKRFGINMLHRKQYHKLLKTKIGEGVGVVYDPQTSPPAPPQQYPSKSLFHRILRVTYTASRFCGEFLCKPLISKIKGVGGRGTGSSCQSAVCQLRSYQLSVVGR